MPTAPEGPSRLPLYVALLAIVAAFLRFGYDYGAGDQDELIPSILRLLDPSLFTRDWLIRTVTDGVNVRTYFLWLAALPSLVLPPWLAVALLWVGVMAALAYGVHALAWEVTRDRLAAALSVLVLFAVTVKWTLGDNSLTYDALVPEGVAWALAVPAIPLFLRRRWALAGALLGVAAWFHLLAGAQTALLLGLLGLLQRTQLRALVRFGGAFVLAALPILVPVALDQFGSGTDSTGVSPLYVHVYFRNPHHHLLSALEPGRHIRFWPLMALGLMSGVALARAGRLRHGQALAQMAGLIAALGLIAVVFGDVVPVALVMKLQLFKLTVLANLFATILVCGGLVRLLPERRHPWGEWLLERQRTGLAATLALSALVLFLAVRGVGRPGALLHPLRHAETPLAEAERWARAETPRDALFAIPPSISTFRTAARRAVVIDFTGFVFSDRDLQTWFERLMDVAPIEPPEVGRGVKPALDAAYHAHMPADWLRLGEQYGIEYVLTQRGAARLPFPIAHENAGWIVYQLPEA